MVHTGSFELLNQPAEIVAPRLLGCRLVRKIDDQIITGTIVETEAYDQTDAASHSYRGKTPRTDIMFGPAGHLYVYFTYGMHYCCNVVTGPAGHGAAVLIRAIEPVSGQETMAQLRKGRTGIELTNGPAKLCQALDINRQLNGHDLHEPPLQLVIMPGLSSDDIIQTTRIGITQAIDVPWRFYIRNNPYVSHQ
jgi:DNA-3-methyladenine glycosylase